jgi:predicted small secreted protein
VDFGLWVGGSDSGLGCTVDGETTLSQGVLSLQAAPGVLWEELAMLTRKVRTRVLTLSLVAACLMGAACGTVTGAAVGAGSGAAIGAGTGYGAGKGALIGTGVGAAAGAIYDVTR